ncbi:hypothetical protein GE061_015870 [Apolygus lucorum]|uniref:Uncharacterized protein n=1 Tax=Apolygus lucorum TaxID=248454 RepID=A0A6A4JUH0_APOLU|nr:hypothetical protein GE061_015870 [Apolygus lucorum]
MTDSNASSDPDFAPQRRKREGSLWPFWLLLFFLLGFTAKNAIAANRTLSVFKKSHGPPEPHSHHQMETHQLILQVWSRSWAEILPRWILRGLRFWAS